VKEAAYKALFPLVRPTWGELSYTSADNAKGLKPALLFEPSLSSDTQVGRMHVSVTHDGEYVLAQVLVEERAGASS
jgi:holo-[acyl-carrier protein] synthase